MPLVVPDLLDEKWESLPEDVKQSIFQYMDVVRNWWSGQTGTAYFWVRNNGSGFVCVQCAVPMITDEEAIVAKTLHEGNPRLETLVCFECIEHLYLEHDPDERTELLAQFRSTSEY